MMIIRRLLECLAATVGKQGGVVNLAESHAAGRLRQMSRASVIFFQRGGMMLILVVVLSILP